MQILETDTLEQIANKIYFHAEVLQSFTVKGLSISGEEVKPKGRIVLDEIQRIFDIETRKWEGHQFRRRRRTIRDSIGGYVAEKIFRWKIETIDSTIRYHIWRIQ